MSERSAATVAAFRPRGTSSPDRLDAFAVGHEDSLSRAITAEDVAAFARLSGDYNALHVDEEFAARTVFRRPVAHGFLHASLLSTLIGMKIPGRFPSWPARG